MDWFDETMKCHEQTFPHECRLSSLPEVWQRELAALWRLEADVNNGAYLQFLGNWGRESYTYASQALKKIGALRMSEIIETCQSLVDEYINSETASREQLQALMPNPVIGPDGQIIEPTASVLPEPVLQRIYDLSDELMDYPDDLPQLGRDYYRQYLEREDSR